MFSFKGIIGHRGAAAYAPENTMAAFNKALSLGCRCVEFDVICSADGEPFVFHDETLKRTTNGRGDFGLVNAEYVKSLDAGRWFSRQFAGEKIPHFREVLEWLCFTGMQANIEIKPYPGTTEQTTVTVLRYINRYWPPTRELPLISCFDQDALRLCQSISPEMPLAFLSDKWQDNLVDNARQFHCYSIHMNRTAWTAERVKIIREAGFAAAAYTVNSRRQALKLLNWGIDIIFSDYPDLLRG